MWVSISLRKWVLFISATLLAAGLLFYWFSSVSRLEAFYQLTQNKPLFYDPALDTHDFKNALDKLKKTENEFLETHFSLMSEQEKKTYPADWRLFPDAFLSTFFEIRVLTGSFLDEPTWTEALSLIRKYRQAARAYEKTASSHLALLENYKKQNPGIEFVSIDYLLGGATNLATIEFDLKLVEKNARALRKETNLRISCLLLGFCGETVPAQIKNQIFSEKALVGPPPELLDPSLAAVQKNYVEVSGPYQISSGCWGWQSDGTPKNQFFYLYKYDRKDGIYLKPKLATENYYLDYEKILDFWPPARLYLDNNLRFNIQPETNNYRCSNNTFGPRIIAMDYLKQNIQERGILDIEKISQAEKKFSESEINDENNFYELRNLYSKAYFQADKKDGVTQNLLWERMLVTQNQLRGLPYLLRNAAGTLELTNLENKFNGKPSNIPYLFASHVNYSIFFLPFSETSWLISEKLAYLLNGITYPLGYGFTTYSQLKTGGYTDREIKEFPVASKEILEAFFSGGQQ